METRQLLVLCAAVVGLVSAGNHEAYSGHTVHGVVLRNSSDAALLQRLQAQLELDLWQPGAPRERDALLMVAPRNKDELLKALDDEGIAHYLHADDVAKAIEKNNEEISIWKSTRKNRMVFQDYLRYPEIDAYMDRIAAQYPNLVTLVNAGKSFEGRDIKYLKISTTNFNDPSKPIYFMNAMIHAREWVTTPVVLYSIYRLVENLRSEDSDLLSDVDWIIMPLVNPNGYEFTHTDAVGVPLSYTLELPGYGYGFLVPPQFVDQINEETWQGIAVTARLARSYYRVRYNAATTTDAPTTAATTAAATSPNAAFQH